MTLLRLFVPVLPSDAGPVRIEGDEFRYLARVRRAVTGEAVELLDGRGGLRRGVIARIDRRGAEVGRLEAVDRPRETPLALAVALGRSEPLARAVRGAVELGVERIVPLRAARRLPRDAEALDGLAARWRRVALEALRTGGRARLPEVEPVREPAAWAAADARGEIRLLLDGEAEPLAPVVERLRGRGPAGWLVVVGPEGGWTAEEGERFRASGCVPAALGAVNLRVETAVVGALAVLRALLG